LYRNDPYAKSAVNTFVSSVVGKGMCLQAKIEKPRGGMNDRLNTEIETQWEKWGEKGNCTVDRRFSIAQLQRQAIRSMIVDGEILIRIIRKKVGNSNVPVALELIEVDQLIDNGMGRAENGNRIIMGVEVDQYNAPVAYHLYPYHPGDYQFTPQGRFGEHQRVPAEEIHHIYVMERPGQVRGVPWLHNVIDRIRNISGYEEAEIVRSRIQSCAVGAITSPEPDAMTDYVEAGEDYKFLSPGEILRLAPGETFTMGNAAAPNPSLEGFLRSMARSIAAGIGISYESLTRDYSNTSYSSARTALLAERDLYEVIQTEFIESFLQPFYRQHWLELSVLSGAIQINGYELKPEHFQAHQWTRRGWPWVDPAKDIQASREALQLKMTTLTRELATRGIDIEELFKERAAEIELAKKYGLKLELEVPQAQGGPAPETEGEGGEEEEDAPLVSGMQAVTPTEPTAPTETTEPERSAIAALSRAIDVLADRSNGDNEEVNINIGIPQPVDDGRLLPELLTELRHLRELRQREAEQEDEEVNINVSFNAVGVPEVTQVESREYPLLPGFTSTETMLSRAKGKTKAKKKKCEKGQVCGLSCISKTKVCTNDMTTAQFLEHNRAKKAERKARKSAIGGHKPFMSEAEAEKYTQDSAWKDRTFFHGTSQVGADILTTQGIDVTKNTAAFYGQGFYMGGTSAQNDGLAIASGYANERPDAQVLEIKIKTKRPLEVTEEEYHALIRKEVQAGNIPKIKVDLESGTVNSDYMQGVTAHLKGQGYDALYIKGLDYAIAFDPQQVAIYNRFPANDPPKASQDKVKAEQSALIEAEI